MVTGVVVVVVVVVPSSVVVVVVVGSSVAAPAAPDVTELVDDPDGAGGDGVPVSSANAIGVIEQPRDGERGRCGTGAPTEVDCLHALPCHHDRLRSPAARASARPIVAAAGRSGCRCRRDADVVRPGEGCQPGRRRTVSSLLGPADRALLVVERGRRQAEPGRAHRDPGVEADPPAHGLAEEVDGEVDVGKHPLVRRDAHGDAVGRVDQAHEIGCGRARLAVDERVGGADPRDRAARAPLRVHPELEAADVAAAPRLGALPRHEVVRPRYAVELDPGHRRRVVALPAATPGRCTATRSSTLRVASTSSMVRPGRVVRTSTRLSRAGMTPRISKLIRASCMPSRGSWASMAWVRMPLTGAMCCSSSRQAPWVCSVGRKQVVAEAAVEGRASRRRAHRSRCRRPRHCSPRAP